ncbi:hypothetical protein L7F22_008391 [Adiantum nelumboides]|nr:hypothetical protein [Adiantum nelumboides]
MNSRHMGAGRGAILWEGVASLVPSCEEVPFGFAAANQGNSAPCRVNGHTGEGTHPYAKGCHQGEEVPSFHTRRCEHTGAEGVQSDEGQRTVLRFSRSGSLVRDSSVSVYWLTAIFWSVSGYWLADLYSGFDYKLLICILYSGSGYRLLVSFLVLVLCSVQFWTSNSSNNKAKEKGVYKGKNRLTPEELERYRKDNRRFKCGEQGHTYRACPQRNARNEQPRASIIEAPKEDVHCKGSPLSYAWGKLREHDAFILFDPGSTHNFISHELAAKLGIQEFEMGDAMKADGAFIGQDASVTPLIGKLRLHIQGYMDKEDFFISPLKHEDVILGAPWFDRLAASIKFPEKRISFKFRGKNMYIDAQESGNTIPLVHTHAFDKSIKSSTSAYMIFVKDSLSDVNKTQVNESGIQEDLDLSKFLNQDAFIDDIPGELPPKRGDDEHAIELILGVGNRVAGKHRELGKDEGSSRHTTMSVLLSVQWRDK